MNEQKLINAAKEASLKSYSPYSNFAVGAALLSDTGEIIQGCNIENASFGLTVCAERTAIGNAIVSGQKNLKAIAIYTPTEHPTPPCGACRQVILEHLPGDAIVLSRGKSGETQKWSVKELIPQAFHPEDLIEK